MSKEIVDCKNCEKPFDNAFKFCPNCGQNSKEELTVGVLFYNTISNYFAVDARFFKSFIPLMFKPGYIPAKFIQGKRLLYLHPAQLYLFISIVFFFLFSFKQREQIKVLDSVVKAEKEIKKVMDTISSEKLKDSVSKSAFIDQMRKNQKLIGMEDDAIEKLDSLVQNGGKESRNSFNFNEGFNSRKIDSLIAIGASNKTIYKAIGLKDDASSFEVKLYTQVLKLYKNKGGATNMLRTFFDAIPIAMFVLLPIFAFILKILFFRRGRFSHHLVFTFYFFAYLFTVFSVLLVVSLTWGIISTWLNVLLVCSTFFYLYLAVKRFYGQGWFISFFKTCLATFSFMLFVIPIAFTLIGLFAFMFY